MFGAFVHGAIVSFGLIFSLNVAYVGSALSAQGLWSSPGAVVGGLRDALTVFLRNVLLPFGEATFLDPMMPESPGIDVWGFWVPGLLSLFFLLVASLGLATLRWRRPPWAIPYALLAAVFLVWQAQVSQVFAAVSVWEDPLPLAGASRATLAQQVQRHLFKMGHESFTRLYSEQQCRARAVRGAEGAPRQVKCEADTPEAKLMPFVVQELCRSRTDDAEAEFAARVGGCSALGQRMKLFQSTPSESDAVFCQCWPAVFDSLQSVAGWMTVVWCGMLLGVLSVLYIAVEPRLSRMSSKEHCEVLCFAAVSIGFLACRVLLFPDKALWAKGLTGLQQEE